MNIKQSLNSQVAGDIQETGKGEYKPNGLVNIVPQAIIIYGIVRNGIDVSRDLCRDLPSFLAFPKLEYVYPLGSSCSEQ